MLRRATCYTCVGLLAMAGNQCRCDTKPTYDTCNLELHWEETGTAPNLLGLDLKRDKGLTCYVPSEEAVYYWNQDSKFYKFTTSPEGTLKCELIASLPSPVPGGSLKFLFAAGSKGNQFLYGGYITHVGSRYIDLYKYKHNKWNYTHSNRAPFPPHHGGGLTMTISKSNVTCCTLETNSQLCGCLFVQKDPTSTNTESLIFDPVNAHFNEIHSEDLNYPVITAVEVAPESIMIGKQQGNVTFGIGKISKDSLTFMMQVNNNIEMDQVNSFLLQPENKILHPEPIIVSHNSSGEATFYNLDQKDRITRANNLPIASQGNSIVLPFSDVVYVITTVMGNSTKQMRCYRGILKSTSQAGTKKNT